MPAIPSWLLPQPSVDLSLLKKINSRNNMFSIQTYVNTLIHERYGYYVHIFTDGSKNPENGKTSCAFYIPELKVKVFKRLTDHLSIYTAEIMAIMLALYWIEEVKPLRILICSDSSAALTSLKNTLSKCREDIMLENLLSLYRVRNLGIDVQFLWIPAHSGIKGNEMADSLAKKGLTINGVEVKVPISKTEIKSYIRSKIKVQWQKLWDNGNKGRHLYGIQQKVGEEEPLGKSRREQGMFSRIRLGHTRLNASLHVIGKHPTGKCDMCSQPETIEHVLFEYIKYASQRIDLRKGLEHEGIKQLDIKNIFSNKSRKTVLKIMSSYLQQTGLNLRI
ncbi:PREDICTED: uncharacterized protein LOC107104854 [Cyprinodon variegatus]|uniref:uncharacterized protein LOC107104854 n=1 Tax=Cyprinodon variegatus TaxID=28743 RepID=UPI0007429E6D|nr:PREDICTED: uncharacterized protein LOC107104854 [Cyprinodon variegatus]